MLLSDLVIPHVSPFKTPSRLRAMFSIWISVSDLVGIKIEHISVKTTNKKVSRGATYQR